MKFFSKRFLSISLLAFVFSIPVFGQESTAGDIETSGETVTRIGVILPKVSLKEETGDQDPPSAVRNTYAALLNSETVEVVALKARTHSYAVKEAKEKDCHYILDLSLVQERKKKKSRFLGRIARGAGRRTTREVARTVPSGTGVGERIARTTAQVAIINTGYTLSNVSITVKKNDEFTLDYRLMNSSGKTLLKETRKAKAKKNKEDILVGMIEESGKDILEVIEKEKE